VNLSNTLKFKLFGFLLFLLIFPILVTAQDDEYSYDDEDEEDMKSILLIELKILKGLELMC